MSLKAYQQYQEQIKNLEQRLKQSYVQDPNFDLIYKKTVQEILRRKGCGVRVIDGKIGPKSINAAKAFAKIDGFSFSGDIYDKQFYQRLTSSKRNCAPNSIKAQNKSPLSTTCYGNPNICLDRFLCNLATSGSSSDTKWSTSKLDHVTEAKRRGLKCGVR